MANFGFGTRWRDWILSCLKSSRGSILVNGSPTLEFQFYKGLKQGDPLSPFLFILVMESLNLSLHNVVSAGLFKGVNLDNSLQLSYLFYADDVVFVGGNMSRIKAWDDVINKVLCRLSKWKIKIISIGGRFTLLKSVLGASPIYFMSMFNAPIQVLKKLESIRNHFFNGVDSNVRKMMLIKWDNVLASKEKGGFGVSSFYALNRALTFKWIWIFRTQGFSLWSRVIKLIHGEDVTNKMAHSSLASSLRCNPRGGIEQVQMANLIFNLEGFTLPNMHDRWRWSLSGDGEFSVASVRNLIDDRTLAEGKLHRCFLNLNTIVTFVRMKLIVSLYYFTEASGAVIQAPKSKISRNQVGRDCYSAHDRLVTAYFSEYSQHNEATFRTRFRMSQTLFTRVVLEITDHCPYFQLRPNCTGKVGISPIMKCTFGIRKMAYGSVPDALDEYMQMSTTTARDSLVAFCTAVMELYKNEYLQKLTYTHIEKLYAHHEQKHEFPRMIRSIDCTNSLWENSPIASKAQFCKRDHGPDPFILLEALASQNLLIWHAFFGYSGMNNDAYVLRHSPIFNDLKSGKTPGVPFVANGVIYNKRYYLTDVIYLE
nr:hypothetical protein [Tanacetum cinerariifolium]